MKDEPAMRYQIINCIANAFAIEMTPDVIQDLRESAKAQTQEMERAQKQKESEEHERQLKMEQDAEKAAAEAESNKKAEEFDLHTEDSEEYDSDGFLTVYRRKVATKAATSSATSSSSTIPKTAVKTEFWK